MQEWFLPVLLPGTETARTSITAIHCVFVILKVCECSIGGDFGYISEVVANQVVVIIISPDRVTGDLGEMLGRRRQAARLHI